MHRIDPGPDLALGDAGIEQAADHVDQRQVHVAQPPRALEVGRAEHVLAGQQRDDLLMLLAVIELELDPDLDGFQRRDVGEVELAFRLAHGAVGAFQHGDIQIFLGAEIIIQHPLVGGGLFGDDVDARAGQAPWWKIRFPRRPATPAGFVRHPAPARAAPLPWPMAPAACFVVTATAITTPPLSRNWFNRCERTGRALAAMSRGKSHRLGAENPRVHFFQAGETSGRNCIWARISRSRSMPGAISISSRRPASLRRNTARSVT